MVDPRKVSKGDNQIVQLSLFNNRVNITRQTVIYISDGILYAIIIVGAWFLFNLTND
jgi:hypothetical protein